MPDSPLITLSIHLSVQLVVTGRFVAMLPGSVLRFSGRNWPLKILPVKLPIQPRAVAVMRLKNRTLSPVAEVFMDSARVVAGAMRAK